MRLSFRTITPTLDTSAYTAGDVLFNVTEVFKFSRQGFQGAKLQSIVIEDKDDQAAAAATLVFLNAANLLGTINTAPNISDTLAEAVVGIVPVASGDWVDLGGCKVASKYNLNLVMEASATGSIYLAALTAGTPTQTASGWVIKLGFEHE